MPLSRRRLAVVIVLGALAAESSAAAEPTKQECVLANENAQDLQHAGKLRDARARLAICVADTCPGAVREDCAQRLAEVDKAMPTLVFEAKDGAGNDVGAVRVTMDGEPLADKLVGTPIPVDPGEHHFVFEAEGLQKAEKALVIHEGDRNRHEVVVLQRAPTDSALASPEAVGHGAPENAPSDGSTRRMLGLVLGGVGVVGLVIGSIEGLAAKSTFDGAIGGPNCGSGAGLKAGECNKTGFDEVGSANKQASISNVGFIAGAALLGGGAVVYFTAPKGGAVSVGSSLGAGTATLTLRGRW